jgi:hypothetical protein
MYDSNGGMANAVEHTGLDGGVMQHVLENDVLSHLQLMVESPKPHEISRQTTVSTYAIDGLD